MNCNLNYIKSQPQGFLLSLLATYFVNVFGCPSVVSDE